MITNPVQVVAIYEDYSELLFLPEEKKYLWMRPNHDRTRMKPIEIHARRFRTALAIVRKLRQQEEK